MRSIMFGMHGGGNEDVLVKDILRTCFWHKLCVAVEIMPLPSFSLLIVAISGKCTKLNLFQLRVYQHSLWVLRISLVKS